MNTISQENKIKAPLMRDLRPSSPLTAGELDTIVRTESHRSVIWAVYHHKNTSVETKQYLNDRYKFFGMYAREQVSQLRREPIYDQHGAKVGSYDWRDSALGQIECDCDGRPYDLLPISPE